MDVFFVASAQCFSDLVGRQKQPLTMILACGKVLNVLRVEFSAKWPLVRKPIRRCTLAVLPGLYLLKNRRQLLLVRYGHP